MKHVFYLSFFILLPALTAAQINEDGWTTLTPTEGLKVIYVSSSEGDDTQAQVYRFSVDQLGNDPVYPPASPQAFRTVEAAVKQVEAGEAAWILLKASDVFYESLLPLSGKSATEPIVYSFYQTPDQALMIDAVAPPLLKTGAQEGFSICCGDFANFWVVGLSFYAHTRNPDDRDYVSAAGKSGFRIYAGEGSTAKNILIEGCRFQFYESNAINGPGLLTDIVVRRNFFFDNYSEAGHSQGLYGAGLRGFTLEENIFDHNGWYKQSINSDNDKAEGQATWFNHDTYFAGVHDVVFRENCFFRPSSIGTKWTANHGEASSTNLVVDNNLYHDCEIGISMGGNESDPPYRFKNISITENVLGSPGLSRQSNRTLGWGIDMNDWDEGVCRRNYLIHQRSEAIDNARGLLLEGESRNVAIEENVLHNLNGYGIVVAGDAAPQNVSIASNQISGDISGSKNFIRLDMVTSEITLQANVYNGTGKVEQMFRVDGESLPYESWVATNLEANPSTDTLAYYQPERRLELYVEQVLGLPDMNAFYTELRQLSRLNWKDEYTAKAINRWIKEGFSTEGPVTTVDPLVATESISVYPNPTDDGKVFVVTPVPGTLKVTSLTGQTVLITPIRARHQVDLSSLQPGCYLLQFYNQHSELAYINKLIRR